MAERVQMKRLARPKAGNVSQVSVGSLPVKMQPAPTEPCASTGFVRQLRARAKTARSTNDAKPGSATRQVAVKSPVNRDWFACEIGVLISRASPAPTDRARACRAQHIRKPFVVKGRALHVLRTKRNATMKLMMIVTERPIVEMRIVMAFHATIQIRARRARFAETSIAGQEP